MTSHDDDLDLGFDLEITKVTRRASGGGTWVCGTLNWARSCGRCRSKINICSTAPATVG